MTAVKELALYSFVIAVVLLLTTPAFAVDSGPELSDLEQRMHWRAWLTYPAVAPLGNRRYRFWPEEDLEYYKNKHSDLEAILHDDAKEGPGVISVGTHEPETGHKITFYSSVIRPDTKLGETLGLQTTTESAPNGKVAFAFWKHEGHDIRLLRINTGLHNNAQYDLQSLESLIPIHEAREIH